MYEERKSFTHMCKGAEVFYDRKDKPLESIFRKPLNEAPPRLQRMLLKVTKYDLVVRYVRVMSPENSRSFQTVLAEHLSVKLNHSVNPNS